MEYVENLVPQNWYPKHVHSGTILHYMVDQKVMVVAIDKEEFVALDIKSVGENFLELSQELKWKRDRVWPIGHWGGGCQIRVGS